MSSGVWRASQKFGDLLVGRATSPTVLPLVDATWSVDATPSG